MEDKHFRKVFQMLRPDFQLPDRKTLCTTILDDCYEHVNGQLREKLDGTRYLNVTFDESTNINDDRILTMSFSTRDASYYYDSELFGDRRLTADEISEIVWRVVGRGKFLMQMIVGSGSLGSSWRVDFSNTQGVDSY